MTDMFSGEVDHRYNLISDPCAGQLLNCNPFSEKYKKGKRYFGSISAIRTANIREDLQKDLTKENYDKLKT